jgi:ketosteroid isomerase-like protein
MKIFIACLFMFVGFSAFGQSQDEKAVDNLVENYRLALIDPTEKNLSALVHDQLTFGHSSGKMENKAEFLEALISGKSNFNSVEFKDQTVTISDNVALVRHKMHAEITENEKNNNINLGVLLVWKKQKSGWKLIARQAYKL